MDEEVVILLKRLGLAFLVAIIFAIPTAIFVYNKFDNSTSDILAKMKKEKVLIFVDGHKCDECKTIKKILKDKDVEYYELNKDIDHQSYKIIMNKIHLSEKYVPAPSLVLVEKGELVVNINEFDNIDLDMFFDDYDL